jgi:hypothetical protein
MAFRGGHSGVRRPGGGAQWLNDGWRSGRLEFRILYGRRVGKSALLDEFARGKPAIVYQGVEGTTSDHLRDLTVELLKRDDDFGVLNHLRGVLSHVPGADETTHVVLFWRSFDPRLRERAPVENITLIAPDDLYA